MYDRYTLTLKNDELAPILRVKVPESYTPQFNAAPTKKLPVITSQNNRELSFFHWGFMSKWSNNKTMSAKFFNLPVNSIQYKVSFQRKLKTHRCIILMDGFFAWKQVSKKRQVPHYFYFPDRRVFFAAGLWEEMDETDSKNKSFIMATRPADEFLAGYQDDMPLLLDTAHAGAWLGTDESITIDNFLVNAQSSELVCYTVSQKIRDIDKNDISFINPVPASDQYGNYTLFIE